MADLNSQRCPRCFSIIPILYNDPLLSFNGAKEIYEEVSGKLITNEITKRLYKGFTQIKRNHFLDIQDLKRRQEAMLRISTPTKFTHDFSNPNFFLITRQSLLELRYSTEQIINKAGDSKDEYFNYDENEVERKTTHQSDWIDNAIPTDTGLYQIKVEHIEDLRHPKSFSFNKPHLFLESYTPGTSFSQGLSEAPLCSNWRARYWIKIEVGMVEQEIVHYQDSEAPDDDGWAKISQTYVLGYNPDDHTSQPSFYNISGRDCIGYWFYDPGWWDGEQFGKWFFMWGGWYNGYSSLTYNMVWAVYREQSWYSGNEIGLILALPPALDNQTYKCKIKAVPCESMLVDETLYYPCYMIAGGDGHKYAQPKNKSPQWVEDVLTEENEQGTITELTSLSAEPFHLYPNEYRTGKDGITVFKYYNDNISTSVGQSSTTEEVFQERNIDANSWGQAYPPPSCYSGNGYLRSVSISGEQNTGKSVLYVPYKCNSKNLSCYLNTFIWDWILTQEDLRFSIDIRARNVESFYNPKTKQNRPIKFRTDCLLAKNNGAKIALNRESGSLSIKGGLQYIPITATNAIPSTFLISVSDRDGKFSQWEYKDPIEFLSATSGCTWFTTQGEVLKFGDGIVGAKLPDGLLYWEVFTNEVPVAKYYPDGHIVLANPSEWEEIVHNYWYHNENGDQPEPLVKLIIKYYNIPHQYNEQLSPIIKYWANYYVKPASPSTTKSYGSGTEIPPNAPNL